MILRVLHVVPIAPDGGTSGFTQRQIGCLAEAGIEGRMVYFGGSAMLLQPHRLLIGIAAIRREIRIFKPAIVHAHWGSLLALATAIASLGGPPLVITYRGSDINPVPSEPWLRSLIRVACSQLAVLRASAVICVSNELSARLWSRPRLVRIVPDGTDVSLFKPMDKLDARRKLNWPTDERVVFFYEGGRPAVKRRDLAEASLIEVRKRLGSCRLEVMGADVPHDRVPVLLNASDCLLMTSDFEGSPNIVREALACNVPVVSVDVGDVRLWLADLEGTSLVSRDPRTYNLDPKLLEAAITPRTKAIIPVSLYGQCADMDAINAIAAKHGIPVIEDAAQSFGATYKGKKSCNLSTIACASFFPSKPLGCYGDGGAIFTNDDDLAKVIRQIARHGQDRRYHHIRVGVNSRLDTLQAAILLPKLAIFDEEIGMRQQVAANYERLLSQARVDTTPYIEQHNTSVYAQYTIRVKDREALQVKLKAAGVPIAVHYPIPLNKQSAVADGQARLPVGDDVAQQVMSLPMSAYLLSEHQVIICNALAVAAR